MSKVNQHKGKRVLITSWSLSAWGGATINSLELAKYLQEIGMVVDLFSYDIDGPVAQYAVDIMGVEVFTDRIDRLQVSDKAIGVSNININKYDYIWVNANIIPISIISGLAMVEIKPRFIFLHMSALPGYPLDAPLMPALESGIASAILSISDDTTKRTIRRILGSNTKVFYYRNPAPRDFSYIEQRHGTLKKIAVISSSHPSDEIMELKGNIKLIDPSIQIDYIGRYNNNEKNVDAGLYSQYDLIIGIGKNVQYSLVSGVPIYVYGKFGGSGYLDDSNMKKNRSNNFSGRGFSRKTAPIIASDIIAGYSGSVAYHNSNRNKWIKEYLLDSVVDRLFEYIESVEPKEFRPSPQQINWMNSMQILLCQYLQGSGSMAKQYNQYQSTIDDQEERIRLLESEISRLNSELNMRLSARIRRRAGIIEKKLFLTKSKD